MNTILFIQEGTKLKLFKNDRIPARYSCEVPCKLQIQDEFTDYQVTGLYQGEFEDKPHYFTVGSDGSFKLPAGFFKYSDGVYLSFAFIKDQTIISLSPLLFDLDNGLDYTDIIPDGDESWLVLVERQVDASINIKLPKAIDDLLPEKVNALLSEYGADIEQLSNPNLLINSDFRYAINQRGKTSYTSGLGDMFTIDRWKINNNSTLTVNSNSVTIKNNHTDVSWFTQPFLNNLELGDYTYTIKVKSVTGSVWVYIGDSGYSKEVLKVGVNTFSFNHSKSTTTCNSVFIKLNAGSKIELEYMKFEQGTRSTVMPIFNKAEELEKCLPYCELGAIVLTPYYLYNTSSILFNGQYSSKKIKDSSTVTVQSMYTLTNAGAAATLKTIDSISGYKDYFKVRATFNEVINPMYSALAIVLIESEIL